MNLRDATVLGKPHGIKDETEALQADLNSWIQSTNNKVNALQKTQDGFKDSLKIQNETLRIAQRKYEDAVSDADRAKTGVRDIPMTDGNPFPLTILCTGDCSMDIVLACRSRSPSVCQ